MPTTKAAVARRNPPRAASAARVLTEEFVIQGRRYRWREGEGVVTDPGARRDAARRGEMAGLFTRAVVPQLERRGARGLVYAAAAPEGVRSEDIRWVAWRAAGDEVPVWGLYLDARLLAEPGEAPANDGFVLVAWGDGPALAWADERPAARTALRAALHAPPPWLERGMRSRDVTFPVRLDRLSGGPARTAAPCVAVLRPQVERDAMVPVAPRDALLELVQAWKRAHGREPFEP